MKQPFLCLLILTFFHSGCTKDEDVETVLNLSEYLCQNMDLERGTNVIACAGGKDNGLFEEDKAATSVFFYPIEGATNVKYFESLLEEPQNRDFFEVNPSSSPVFNGYLSKVNIPEFTGGKWAIVTYETPGEIHISDPIRLKTNSKPTEVNDDLLTITENSTEPSFSWQTGLIDENVIYFHVISDSDNNLISGTYTIDQNFTFYDLSNVVLDVSPQSPTPKLQPNDMYNFTLMGVSEDNWINMISLGSFSTE